MSRQVSRGSVGEYQADEQAGVARLRSQVSGRWAGRCRAAQLASVRQMSGQVSRGLAGDYQSDERAGVARLPASLALAGAFFTAEPAGKPLLSDYPLPFKKRFFEV